MSDQPSQEEILEQQKANCIFCKIVKGEVDSIKAYEDDNFLGIMDIRPAAVGHVILLPKDHAPILQLLPQDKLLEIYAVATKVAHAVKKATIAEKVSIFAANGFAAGQQAPHAMLHIIPREKGDGLDKLDLEELNVDQSDALALSSVFAQATEQAIAHLGRQDILQKEPPAEPSVENEPPAVAEESHEEQAEEVEEFEDPQEALQTVLATNTELRNLLIAQPSFVEDYVEKSPRLKALFEGVDIHALSRALRAQDEQGKVEKKEQVQKASDMSDEDLFKFIDGNEGLRTWLLEKPEELANNISENPRLSKFFDGVDIVDLAMRYRAHHQARGAE